MHETQSFVCWKFIFYFVLLRTKSRNKLNVTTTSYCCHVRSCRATVGFLHHTLRSAIYSNVSHYCQQNLQRHKDKTAITSSGSTLGRLKKKQVLSMKARKTKATGVLWWTRRETSYNPPWAKFWFRATRRNASVKTTWSLMASAVRPSVSRC